ncbi:MAG TPA: PAS domain S-box protein, partial [Candidatus Methylomirabilis sp.]|nr:PAS domain S-box protein [Candidatus Methylomirabilis sp.]
VVEHQTELVCRFLRNGTLTFVNPAYARYFGKSPDELIGQSFLHSVPEEDRQAAMEHIGSLGRNLSTGSCESRVFTAQDEVRWLQWVDQPICDDDGRVVEFQSVGRDITKRKRAEESLQRSEERFRRVLETAPDGMVLVQADATIAFANEQMEKVLGYTREELIGQGMEMLALESVQGQAQHRLDGFVHARARPGGSGLELYGRRKDGSEVPLEIRLSPLETKEGVLVCAAIRDITDRKRAEEALRQSEERYRAIVEDQTEMICRWLPDATLTFVNQAYCRYFGKTRQELIGTSYVSLIPEADREVVEDHIASVIASVSEANPISTCEHSVVLASGEIRWQQWTDRAIFDAQGRLVGFQSVGHDITHRKRAERRHNTQYAVAQVLADSGSLRNAVSPLLRAICEGIGWEVGELWYVDPTPNVLRWGGLWHAPFVEVAEFEAVSRATTFVPGHSLPGRVWASGEPTWIPDVRTEPGFIRASVAAKVGLHGAMAFPIQGDREVTGVMVFFSRRVLQPDPELLWTMFDIGGRIGQFMERKRAEEALRDSEERYRTLVEYSPAAIVVHDLESGRYVDCNQRAIDLFGLDRDRLLEGGPEAVSPRLQPDGTPSEEKLRAATSKGLERDRLEYDYTFVNAAGQEIPCEVRAVRLPVKDRILLRASIVNIADRKRAEEALEKHRAFLRQVIDIDPNFIFAKDREGRFTLVNQAVADAYGTTVEDLLGKTDADFNPKGEEVELFRRMDLEVMDTLQERFIREERMTDAEGNVRWLQTVKRPIVGEDGTANQVLGSATDITRRKRAEEELRAREAALRDSQKDLQDLAGKLLKAQEEERRRLARELHDDLTQRLAVLAIEAGRLEQQLQGAPNPALERLRHMKEQIVKLSADVHGISRQLHPSILDDLGLVSAMESECANLTQRAGIAVKYESHNVPTTLPQDVALCLYRIAQEALWNIAKHAQTTEAFVSLVGTEDAITLSVWDDGVGFDPAQLHRKPGLGLASMEERVRLIRGELSVKSEPGRGTEIEVTVPLRRD